MKASVFMKARRALLNPAVALLIAFGAPALADDASLDGLYQQLLTTDDQGAEAITAQIYAEWAKSGSPSMDLLLMRGRQAMQMGDQATAIGHFTAIIDHAPQFAEAWNARATAFYNAGELGPSIADIQHTLALNPKHFGALSGLGMIFEQLDQPDKALEVYQAALGINPHLPRILDAVERLSEAKGQDL